jgi:protein SCO1/2
MKRLLCMLAALTLCASGLAAPKPAPPPGDSVYRLSVQLTDQHGRRFDWGSRRGKVQLVSMFYTSCQYICPLIVDSGKAVDRQLTASERERLGVLLVSMDPIRDTPAALMSVASKRKLDSSRWTLASPAQADVREIAGVLGIRYRALADGEFNHTSALVLLDADGRILARTEQVGGKVDPQFLTQVRSSLRPAP